MKLSKIIPIAVAFASLTVLASTQAADPAGKWTTEFDSPIGVQKYSYEFKVEGAKVTGKAVFDHSMGKGESELKSVKFEKDDVSFTENLKLPELEIVITYVGKITGDEMKLTRTVGEFGTEQIVAKRVKAEPAKPAGK